MFFIFGPRVAEETEDLCVRKKNTLKRHRKWLWVKRGRNKTAVFGMFLHFSFYQWGLLDTFLTHSQAIVYIDV